ncbi:MAG: hypothetical protein AB1714_09845 [Acidobacteriota bacterium]
MFERATHYLLIGCVAAAAIWVGSASAQEDILSRQVVYRVPGMDKVQVKSDVTYKSADGVDLKMDIYTPGAVADAARLPAVVFIHGGYLSPADRPKDWGGYTSYGRLMAASGMIGVTFNHRYYGWDEKNLSQSVGDVSDAIAYVRGHADSLRVDPQRICLWAFSGGGPHLVVALREPLDYIRCVVSYYALLDAGQPVRSPGRQALPDAVAERYSPVRYVSEKNPHIPPIFIGRAGLDSVDINRSVDEFLARAFACGVTVELANHPAGQHAFDILDDDTRSREIIARTIDFLKSNAFGDRLEEVRSAQRIAGVTQLFSRGDILGARKLAQTLRADRSIRPDLVDHLFSESALNGIGYRLIGDGKSKEAVEVFEWVFEEHPDSPNACDSLGDAYEAAGRKEDALRATEKAQQLLEKASGLSESQRISIRQSIEARLKRLQ